MEENRTLDRFTSVVMRLDIQQLAANEGVTE